MRAVIAAIMGDPRAPVAASQARESAEGLTCAVDEETRDQLCVPIGVIRPKINDVRD